MTDRSAMSCTEVRAALLNGEAPTGPGADAHLRECEACAALVDADASLAGALGPEEEPPPDEMAALLTSVRAAVGQETGPRAWARSRPTPARLLAALVLLAAVALFVVARSPRADLAEMSKIRLVAAVVLYGGLAFASMLVAMQPLQRPALPWRVGRALIVTGLLVAVAFALTPAATGLSLLPGGAPVLRPAVTCFAYGVALSAPLLAIGWLLDRGGYTGGGRLLFAGGAAGLGGSLFLELHCSMQLPSHLVLGHVTVVVALLGGGLLLSLGRG